MQSVLHSQDRIPANAFIRAKSDDPFEGIGVPTAAHAIRRRGKIGPERARTANARRVRIMEQGGLAIRAEVAGANFGRPAAEVANARVEEVEHSAAQIGSEGAPHGSVSLGNTDVRRL
jgi:hypothetical protein